MTLACPRSCWLSTFLLGAQEVWFGSETKSEDQANPRSGFLRFKLEIQHRTVWGFWDHTESNLCAGCCCNMHWRSSIPTYQPSPNNYPSATFPRKASCTHSTYHSTSTNCANPIWSNSTCKACHTPRPSAYCPTPRKRIHPRQRQQGQPYHTPHTVRGAHRTGEGFGQKDEVDLFLYILIEISLQRMLSVYLAWHRLWFCLSFARIECSFEVMDKSFDSFDEIVSVAVSDTCWNSLLLNNIDKQVFEEIHYCAAHIYKSIWQVLCWSVNVSLSYAYAQT